MCHFEMILPYSALRNSRKVASEYEPVAYSSNIRCAIGALSGSTSIVRSSLLFQ